MPGPAENYFRYLPVSQRDRQWGLFVTDAGWQSVAPGEPYPPRGHPRAYAFRWAEGRALPEYQLVYVTRGAGEFESEATGRRPIVAGTMLFLFPGVWHRYRPDPQVGWDEFWVGFNGDYADRVRRHEFIAPREAVVATGHAEQIQVIYRTILERIRSEPSGFEQMIAANTLELVAATLGTARGLATGGRAYDVVQQAKAALGSRFEQLPEMTELARSLGLSPSHFYRTFKEHTGLTPYQYHLQVRLNRAKALLRDTPLAIKEIARSLGFETTFHFSNDFRARIGVSPTQWRAGQHLADSPRQPPARKPRASRQPRRSQQRDSKY